MILSIAILSYNSEKTIHLTLLSLQKLSLKNMIELVFSDDYSKDLTVNIIKMWAKENEKYFNKIIINVNPFNLGISANHTKALNLSSGNMFTYLGADDIIIYKDIYKISKKLYLENKVCTCFNILEIYEKYTKCQKLPLKFFKMNCKRQYNRLLFYGNRIKRGPGIIYNASILKKIGCFGEYNPYYEDWQAFIRLTKNKYKIEYCNILLVGWKRNGYSMSFTKLKLIKSFDWTVIQKEINPNNQIFKFILSLIYKHNILYIKYIIYFIRILDLEIFRTEL